MAKTLSDQVIVITGASSGIGLATAEQAALAGARLVITARDAQALQQIAQRLHDHHGATVLPVAADVAVRSEVEAVADAAMERFGRIDTWVNNAGVGLVGSVLDAHDEPSARRLFETNFWGSVNGSLAAAARMRRSGGVLINLASILADHAVPLQTFYSASKHAIKGFTDGLRQELQAEHSPLEVVLVKPACIATPLIEHAAHPPGRHPRLVSPLYAPGDAARAILRAAQHPQRDVEVGGVAALHSVAAGVAPQLLDLAAPLLVERQWRDEASPGSDGNLHTPSRDSHGRTLGQHPGQRVHPSVYNRLAEPAGGLGGLFYGALAGGAWLLAQALRSGSERRHDASVPAAPRRG
ncbi:SDR family oxidoreductase [Azohydromonas caseinilytica]|uniref:SDR family NAD(P)-dependent oxidoreductase n=1 Tax=Azohydromonas caseinilytica TaxID=2728836 RepID=A0A848FF15_9BURK|nr:SDR family oxidoreductase [Azohydromonas caseinilytica]NML18008.1 SDR family NAD(P)-dependent oxidoreductase [Azohydromonas caseinilytica]